MGDTLNHPGAGLQVERTRCPHGHAPDVSTCILALGHFGADQIARLEPEMALPAREITPWKSKPIEARALVTSPARRLDLKRRLVPIEHHIDRAHTGRIERMGLRQPKANAVVFRAPAGCYFNRQSGRFKPAIKRPTGCIDRGGIVQGALGVRENPLQSLRIMGKKLSHVLGLFRSLQGAQASVRLLTRSLPPLALG